MVIAVRILEQTTKIWQFSILYLLQCPPFRLSYQGLGEPLCFAAFGPFATTAFYLLLGSTRLPILITNNFMVFHFPCHNIDSDGFDRENLCPSITATVLSASLLVGLTTSLILFCSHFHQVVLFLLGFPSFGSPLWSLYFLTSNKMIPFL